MDANLKFNAVTALSGIYSDISREAGGTIAVDPQLGILWTVNGGDAEGFKLSSYSLDCTYDSGNNRSTCADANLLASWKSTAGSGACNGALTGTTCASSALELTSNDETQFVMDGAHASFEKTEDWFTGLKVPTYSTMTFKISQ